MKMWVVKKQRTRKALLPPVVGKKKATVVDWLVKGVDDNTENRHIFGYSNVGKAVASGDEGGVSVSPEPVSPPIDFDYSETS